MSSLSESKYLKFPFTMEKDGPLASTRAEHVREQIVQVLFTNPKERVFRPEFGVGVRRLIFEPNNANLRNTTIQRINVSLGEALFGEVDPRTLEVEVLHEDAKLIIKISYVLAALNKRESYSFVVGP